MRFARESDCVVFKDGVLVDAQFNLGSVLDEQSDQIRFRGFVHAVLSVAFDRGVVMNFLRRKLK